MTGRAIESWVETGTVASRRMRAWWRPVTAIGALVGLELLALTAVRIAWQAVRDPGPASLDEALLLVVLVAGALLGGWVVLSTVVACAAHLPGRLGGTARHWAQALAPAVTRRVAAVLVGAALGATLAPATAGATTGPPGSSAAALERSPGFARTAATPVAAPVGGNVSGTASDPAPGWTPSRPAPTPAPVTHLVTTGSEQPSSEVVVHRGDTLWGIVHRHLGHDASDAEVAATWPHWYAANRDVIGPDPDALLPGQVLRAPEPGHSRGPAVRAHR